MLGIVWLPIMPNYIELAPRPSACLAQSNTNYTAIFSNKFDAGFF